MLQHVAHNFVIVTMSMTLLICILNLERLWHKQGPVYLFHALGMAVAGGMVSLIIQDLIVFSFLTSSTYTIVLALHLLFSKNEG